MATPIYPASNNQQAIDLNISNANQFFTILQGGIEDFIPTYEGNGEIPSVAKALNEAAAYKEPLAWQTSGEETDLLQPREYNGNIYVPLKVPATFTTAPSNEFWRLYSEKSAQILIDNLTFTGDGVTTDFSVPSMVVDDPAAYFVSVDGVDQRPTIDYTVDVSTDTLSFSEAPPATVADNISVTVLGALRGALADGVYETVSAGLAETPTDGFFNVVNSTDPEAFIDLYKNNAGSALLIDTYPNKFALDNAVDLLDTVQNEVVAELDKRTIYVGSVAEDISGLTGADGQAYHVTGWQAGTEIGGGNFVFRSAKSKSSHNGITVFSPTVPAVSAQAGATLHERSKNYRDGVGETDATGAGAFVREYGQNVALSPTIDVFWSGAEGIAAVANDSTSAIQDCINLIGAAGGGKLFLPKAGDFYTTAEINLVSNLEVFGGGRLVTDGQRIHHGFKGTDLENVVIDGVVVEALTAQDGFDTAIFFLSCENTVVKNCTINNIGRLGITHGHGIRFDAISEPPLPEDLRTGVQILNNKITNIFGDGQDRGDHIVIEGYSNILIDGNYLNQCERMSIALADYCTDFKITNNTILNAGLAGIDFEEDVKLGTLHGGTVTGNYIENWGNQLDPASIGSQKYAVDFHDLAREIVFSNNVCVSGPNSIEFVHAMNGASDFIVTNNLFIGDVTGDAVKLFEGNAATRWDISNNTFIGDVGGRLLSAALGAEDCRFSNNRHYGSGAGSAGVRMINLKNPVCENNVIGAFPIGIEINGNDGTNLGKTIVRGNIIDGVTDYGIKVQGAGGTIIESVSLHDNTVVGSTATAGVLIAALTGGEVRGLTYSGNVFSGVSSNVSGGATTSEDYNYVTNTASVSTPFAGQLVFSFDDNKLMQYDGTAWV